MKGILEGDIFQTVAARHGHFQLESGHHGDLWLDLGLLFSQPRRVLPWCVELAKQLAPFQVEVVCGPLIEGSFAGLLVASELEATFVYSERFMRASQDGLFPADYRLPEAARALVRGKRTAIVNDVINAGSAVRGTWEDVELRGARNVAIGAFMTLGNRARKFAESRNLPLKALVEEPIEIWEPAACPLCGTGVPLEDPGGFARAFEQRS